MMAALLLGAALVYVLPFHPRRLALAVLIVAWALWSGGADGLTLIAGTLVLALGTAVVVGEVRTDAYYALLFLLMGAMVAVVQADDLFNLWLWFECMAIAAYVLVAYERAALSATVKYFIQSTAGSMLIVAGIALVLAQTGSVAFAGIQADTTVLMLAGGLFVIGFGVKAALVPLHTWLPDAHSQAPSGISAMLSGTVIAVGLLALLRTLLALAGAAETFGLLLMVFATLNIIIGNLLALRQTQVKRLLAFSSVAHMGYIVLGVGVGLYAHQPLALEGGLFHLFSHGLMKGLAFLAVGALLLSHSQHFTLEIADLSGTSQRYPLVALALAVALLGLGGLPPLVGFMSKWQIFTGGMAAQDVWVTLALVVAGLGSILSLAYYAPVVNALYRQTTSSFVATGEAIPRPTTGVVVVLALVVVVLGVLPGLLDGLVQVP